MGTMNSDFKSHINCYAWYERTWYVLGIQAKLAVFKVYLYFRRKTGFGKILLNGSKQAISLTNWNKRFI